MVNGSRPWHGVLTKTSAALWSGAALARRPAAWVRLDVHMAVRLDSETLLASVGRTCPSRGRVPCERGVGDLRNRTAGAWLRSGRSSSAAVPGARPRAARVGCAVGEAGRGDAGGETYLDVPEGMPTF